jgi:aminoglycoside N3'-acetyltransferase
MASSCLSRGVVAEQLRALGVRAGRVLLVHTSYRAVRPVERGPEGVIEALTEVLGPEGTLVMPSWSGDDSVVFDPAASPAAADLGIVAETFRRLPEVVRSDHAFAFAARGRHAAEIVVGPLPIPPHTLESPVGRVHALDGQVLLLGVGHDANTTLHLAELLAGVPYRVLKSALVRRNGAVERIEYGENDHCCARFGFADDWLRARGLQCEGSIGNAHARLMRARDVVHVAVEQLRREPLVFLHPAGSGCAECEEARLSVAARRHKGRRDRGNMTSSSCLRRSCAASGPRASPGKGQARTRLK